MTTHKLRNGAPLRGGFPDGPDEKALPDLTKDDTQEAPSFDRVRIAWQKQLVKTLSSQTTDEKKNALAELKKQESERALAYQMVRAIDHQLKLAGSSLAAFQPKQTPTGYLREGQVRTSIPWPAPLPFDLPEGVEPRRFIIKEAGKPPYYEVPEFKNGARPCLTLCGDQGAGGLPAWLFLCGALKLRCLPMYDPFHRTWRDWQLSVQSVELWGVVLETTVAMNLPHGPWLSETWFAQLQEGISAYSQTSGVEDHCALVWLGEQLDVALAWRSRGVSGRKGCQRCRKVHCFTQLCRLPYSATFLGKRMHRTLPTCSPWPQ